MAGINNPKVRDYSADQITAFDSRCEQIREALRVGLPWLERSFGRAYRMPKGRTESTIILPHVYIGNDEYQEQEPNDAIKSHSFIVGDDPASTPLDDLQSFSQVTRWVKPIRIIFFVDYSKIFKQDGIGGGYPFSEILIEQAKNVLWRVPRLVPTGYVSETIQEVYEGFDLSEIEQKLLFYPFGAFRLDYEVSYEITCIP